YPVQHARAPVDRGDLEPQRLGYLILRRATLDRAADHPVLLYCREAIDPLVVGVALVIRGDDALHLSRSQVPERFDPQLSVEEEVSPDITRVGSGHRRFDETDRAHRTQNLGIFLALLHARAKR